jgi:hypothetical protein
MSKPWGQGHVIAQEVSRQLPTVAAQVWAQVRSGQVRSCGICGGQNGTGAGFLQILQYPLAIIPLITHHHPSSIIHVWCNRPNSGWCTKWTQSHPTSSNPRAMVQLEGLGKLKKSNDLIRTWTYNVPTCSTVHQPTTLPRAPLQY